jgi:DNA-directed RNA polymerase subunit N
LWPEFEEFQRSIKAGEDPGKVLDELGVKRYCCRRTMLAAVDISKEIIKFSTRVHRW